MPRADFAEALREADERLAARGMPASAERRVLERLRHAAAERAAASKRAGAPRARGKASERGSRRWLAAPALALAAAVALAIVGLRFRAPGGEAPAAAITEVAGFAVIAQSGDLAFGSTDGSAVDVVRGACTLRDATAGITLELPGAARVRRGDGGVRVEAGKVAFAVDRRPGGEPRRVLVSHGEIRITGTRFTVEQRTDGGSVILYEGSIEFAAPGHEPIALRPGESLGWPLPPAPAPVSVPASASVSAPVPVSASVSASVSAPVSAPASASQDDVLRRIEMLRSQGRYAEAAELAAASPATPATRERLSYERGGIYTYQLRDRDKACAHWRRHVQEFPGGRYAVEVGRAQRHLGCP